MFLYFFFFYVCALFRSFKLKTQIISRMRRRDPPMNLCLQFSKQPHAATKPKSTYPIYPMPLTTIVTRTRQYTRSYIRTLVLSDVHSVRTRHAGVCPCLSRSVRVARVRDPWSADQFSDQCDLISCKLATPPPVCDYYASEMWDVGRMRARDPGLAVAVVDWGLAGCVQVKGVPSSQARTY